MPTVPVRELRPGDVIWPPPRELRLWMRRECARRGLLETALLLTVVSVEQARPDRRGAWCRVRATKTAAWCRDRTPGLFFQARPATPWSSPQPVDVEAAEATSAEERVGV